MAALRGSSWVLLWVLLASRLTLSPAHTAPLTSVKTENGNVLSATYASALFGREVTVLVSPTAVSLVAYAPTPVMPSTTKAALDVSMNETYALPANASDFTSVDHITIFYDPDGAFPYPAGQNNPMWNHNISSSMSCVTCWFYVTFFYVSENDTLFVAPECGTSPSFFCSADQLQSGLTAQPYPSLLPSSFVNASGDFYSSAVVHASLAGIHLDRLHSIADTVTPLTGFRLGQLWVSSTKKPYTYTYNGTTVLAPSNYYVSDNGQVIGVGQVVSRDYFSFFANFFANSDPSLQKFVSSAQPFDVPSNFSEPGLYPAAAQAEINGYLGTTTFTFGFSNTTFREPPSPKAGSALVLHLPWLVASIWLAGAVVMLSDHL